MRGLTDRPPGPGPRAGPRGWLGRLGRRGRLAPLVGSLALGGCYTYAVAAPAALPTGAQVRVALTDAGAAGLAPTVGSAVSGVEGAIVRQRGDTLVVRASRLLTSAGVDVAWTGPDLGVPAPWRSAVERKRIAAGRTSLLVAGGIAVSAGAIALIRGIRDRGGDGGDGGGDPIGLSRRRP